MKLQGSWRPGITLRQDERMGSQHRAVIAGTEVLQLWQTAPGLLPVHYGQVGDYLHWDESEWDLHRRLRGLGVKHPKVSALRGGETVRFNGRTVTSTGEQPAPRIPIYEPGSMAKAQTEFCQRLLFAVDDMCAEHGPPYLLLSGGVDSIAVAWAMKHLGIDVHCLTVGRSINDFDPHWASRVAAYLDLPWTFIPLPESDAELQDLLTRTVRRIEQTSFSNVLMGMCVELARAKAVELNRHVGYMGFWADLLFGHKLQVVGSFNQRPAAERTDANWSQQRMATCWHLKPHTMQLSKGLRAEGGIWRTPYLHAEVYRYAYSLPLAYAPAAMDKPLLYGMMNQYLPHEVRAWDVEKKIGFYTGAGAGKIRLKNPVLQDPNIRATYASLKARYA